jgi:Mce-associated membrane protein
VTSQPCPPADDAEGPYHARPLRRQRRARRRAHVTIPLRWIVVGALSLLAVVAGGWLGWQAVDHHRQERATADAVQAASRYVSALINISAGTADRDFTALYDSCTAEFDDAHQDAAAGLRQMIIEKKVVVTGHITHTNVESATLTRVTVVLLADQSVRNIDITAPQTVHASIKLTMEKVGGRWLVNDVKLQ